MILKKGQILDLGDPLHLRVKKCADVQHSVKTIEPLLSLFAKQFQDIHTTQRQILECLRTIYGSNSSYSQLVGRACQFIERCLEIGVHECSELSNVLQKNKKQPVNFGEVTDSVKEFFESDSKFQRQQKKTASLKPAENPTGCMATSKAKKYQEAQKKLEELRAIKIVKSQRVVETSNKINAEKYAKINPATQHFFNVCLLGVVDQREQIEFLRGYEEILEKSESPVLVDQFFVDVGQFRLRSENDSGQGQATTKPQTSSKQYIDSIQFSPSLKPPPAEIAVRQHRVMAHDSIEKTKEMTQMKLLSSNVQPDHTKVTSVVRKDDNTHSAPNLPEQKFTEKQTTVNKSGLSLPERQFMVLRKTDNETVLKSSTQHPIEAQYKKKEKISTTVDNPNDGFAVTTTFDPSPKPNYPNQKPNEPIDNPFIIGIDKQEQREKSKERMMKAHQKNRAVEEQTIVVEQRGEQGNKGLSKKEEELIYKLKIKTEF
jgi:hypothetical protein